MSKRKPANPDTRAISRVIRFRKERKPSCDGLWHIPSGSNPAGLRLMQSDDGLIFLTRTSRDGFVQTYVLSGADGKQLRTAKADRP